VLGASKEEKEEEKIVFVYQFHGLAPVAIIKRRYAANSKSNFKKKGRLRVEPPF
jgi:hypothetical protein